jgi:hypothetical protein
MHATGMQRGGFGHFLRIVNARFMQYLCGFPRHDGQALGILRAGFGNFTGTLFAFIFKNF